jgi:hypothetical protein
MNTTTPSERRKADPVSLSAALSAGKKVPPDAFNVLMQDHREVMGLFQSYDLTTDTRERRDIVARICMDLKVHMQFEEELFYEAARDVLDDEDLVDEAVDEHDEAKSIMERLEGRTKVDAAFTRDVHALKAAIEQHVTVEETELFPRLKQASLDSMVLGAPLLVRRAELFAELTGKPLPNAVIRQ